MIPSNFSLKKLKTTRFLKKISYSFHYINEDDFTFMCMAETNFSKRMAFAFLEDIKENFGGKYTYEQKINAIAFSLNNSFYSTMKEKMVTT